MGESYENLLKAIRHCQQSLDKYTENRNDSKLLHYLQRLYKLPIKVVHLEETGVGRTVNGLRKLGGDVGDSAKGLVAKWKDMVVGEQEEEEDDDDEEDGYQTGEDESDSEEEKDKDTSSHRKSDNNRTDDRSKRKHSSKSESHSSDKSSKRDERHKHKHNEHRSRKHESESSSEDETPRKRHRKEDEDRHRSRSHDEYRHKSKKSADSDSEEESKSKEKKHKSDKHKSDKKKSRESSLESENMYKSSKSKERQKESSSQNKDKHKSSKKLDSKRQEHSSKTKDSEKRSKDKHRVKNKSEDKKEKSSKPKVLNGGLTIEGIGSGSGASFAEALGMCEPSSSKSSSKKKTIEKKEIPSTKTDHVVPKLLKELAADPPVDLNISSLLPPITPNYRPLGNLIPTDMQARKLIESETLANIITSKNQRTKVYSGNKTGNSVVPSLFELCIRLLQDHIDALEYTGGVPYHLLKPILEKANPNQLYLMEHHNPYLIEDTDELWALHCQKEFRNKERQEMETWRDMYLRCLDERDARLKALTANIKQAQDKSLPVRMTKLAYVDAVAKPPRNIARRQAKNGTAFDVRKPSPSAKLCSLATAGEAGKVAVPNPGSRAMERSGGHAAKPKKAPLMLKSISSFKNRFKR